MKSTVYLTAVLLLAPFHDSQSQELIIDKNKFRFNRYTRIDIGSSEEGSHSSKFSSPWRAVSKYRLGKHEANNYLEYQLTY